MKILRKICTTALLAVCLPCSIGLVLSAHSLWLDPSAHGILSLINLTFPLWVLLAILLIVLALVMKSWSSLLVLALSLVWSAPQISNYWPMNSGAQVSEDKGQNLKVLSYNVAVFYKVKGAWDIFTNYILKSDADIVLIQEYHESGSLSALSKAYPYRHVGITGDKGGGSQLAIFSRLPILSNKDMRLKSAANGGWSYLLKRGKDTIWVANCHFESNKLDQMDVRNYEKAISDGRMDTLKEYAPALVNKLSNAARLRAPQARRVDSLVQDHLNKGHKVIVAGDFNDSPQSYTHEALALRLKDAYKASGHGPGYSYQNGRMRFRIDHILTSPDLEALSCKVDAGITASDHFPIVCTLKMPD